MKLSLEGIEKLLTESLARENLRMTDNEMRTALDWIENQFPTTDTEQISLIIRVLERKNLSE